MESRFLAVEKKSESQKFIQKSIQKIEVTKHKKKDNLKMSNIKIQNPSPVDCKCKKPQEEKGTNELIQEVELGENNIYETKSNRKPGIARDWYGKPGKKI